MRLMHNTFSLSIYKSYKKELAQNSQTTNNISSGKKLNSAKDNPQKISQVDILKINIESRKQARDNVQDVDSMIQTYDGALQEMNNNISRLKTLISQAANGTNDDSDRAIIQKEIDEVKQSINDLANDTSFNGLKLSQSAPMTRTATIGGGIGETIDIPYFNVTASGLDIAKIDVTKSGINVSDYLDLVNTAMTKVNSIRSKYGTVETWLEDTLNNYDEINNTLESAQSDIEDADMATEMTKLTSSQVMIKASISLMAQSNQLPQDCLNILTNSL